MKFWNLASTVVVLTLSGSVNAAIISTDWQTADDDLITQDTASGLEWLDLTVTAGMSFNDVSAQFGSGGNYDGWRYATRAEVAGLWDSFGGDGVYTGWSSGNNGLFDVVSSYVGDLYCESAGCTTGSGVSSWLTGDTNPQYSGLVYRAQSGDFLSNPLNSTQDNFDIESGLYRMDIGTVSVGSALVREVSPVPVPAAVWLFGSGLISLVGFARHKKA